MGFFYSLKQLASGNFENAFNGAFVSDDLLAAQDLAGNNLTNIIARQQAEGLIDSEGANAAMALMSPNTNSDAYWETAGATPWTEFETSITENASKIGGFGASAINKITGIGFKMIPWQVWILAFVLVLIWAYPIWKPFALSLAAKK